MTDTAATQPRVFLSFAAQDSAAAQRLCGALEAAGQPCWIATRDLPPQDPSAAAIGQAIDACRMLVALLSAHAVVSPQVAAEIRRARTRVCPVLAVRLDGTALPPEFARDLGTSRILDASQGTVEAVLPDLLAAPRPGPRRRRIPLLLGILALLFVYLLADRYWLSRIGAAPDAAAVSVPPADEPDLPVSTTVAEKSLAVLPFADLSDKKDQDYFAQGLSEDLIGQLLRVPGLHVPAGTSSFHFKGQSATVAEIAEALGVSYVLEGTVRRTGNRVRVHVALKRAEDGLGVWSETFDRDLSDILKVRDAISEHVAAALQLAAPRRVAGDRTSSIEAYDQTLLGRYLAAQPVEGSGQRALEAYHRALAQDPGYLPAWTGLALAEAMVGDRTGDPGGIARGLAAAQRAIDLAPGSAEGYGVRGLIRVEYLWDWAGAASDFDKVQSLDPGSHFAAARADLAEALGHGDEAIRLLEAAVQQDPLSAADWNRMSRLLLQAGRIDEGRAAAHRALDIDPDLPAARLKLAVAAVLEGRAEEAFPEAQAVSDEQWRLLGLALVEYSRGNAAESQRALDALVRGFQATAAYQVAEAYAWRGDRDHAFGWLDRAFAQHDRGLPSIKLDVFMGALRPDPRYAALLRRLRLPP